jgi:dUTP pyrophosphatase
MMQFKKTKQALELEANCPSNFDQKGEHKFRFTPLHSTSGSAGYDLFACIAEPVTIYPDEVKKIGTGVHIWLGEDEYIPSEMKWCGLLMPRSSNEGCILNNTLGLLDSDYQGELIAKWRNVTDAPITFTPGQKFCQLLIVPAFIGMLTEVEEFEGSTERGESGFGSTGG